MCYWLACGTICVCRNCVEKEPICFSESNLCFCWLDTPISLYSAELLVFSRKSCWWTISTFLSLEDMTLKFSSSRLFYLGLFLNIHMSPFSSAFLCKFVPKLAGSWFYILMCCSSNYAMFVIAQHLAQQLKMTTDTNWYLSPLSLKNLEQGWATPVLEGHCPAVFSSNPN